MSCRQWALQPRPGAARWDSYVCGCEFHRHNHPCGLWLQVWLSPGVVVSRVVVFVSLCYRCRCCCVRLSGVILSSSVRRPVGPVAQRVFCCFWMTIIWPRSRHVSAGQTATGVSRLDSVVLVSCTLCVALHEVAKLQALYEQAHFRQLCRRSRRKRYRSASFVLAVIGPNTS